MPTAPRPALRVYANPYLYVDHAGRLAGVTPFDPDHSAGRRMYIGAEIDVENTKVEKRAGDARTDVVWSFAAEASAIPDSAYHRKAVAEGSVVAADERTARGCGVAFKDPAAVLAAARAQAIVEWAWAHLGDAPSFATPEEVSALAQAWAAPSKTPGDQRTALLKALTTAPPRAAKPATA